MVRLLLKVGCMATGTLVWRCEPRCLLDRILAIDVVAHAWWGVAIDVIGVVPLVVPREDLEESAQRGDVRPRNTGKDGTS